jgi:oxygen-independent coproporphyrinogen-3 oxidase
MLLPVFQKQFGKDFATVFSSEIQELQPFVTEGSLTIHSEGIEILEQGRLFLRNIAMVFDAYLKGANAFKSYSRTV